MSSGSQHNGGLAERNPPFLGSWRVTPLANPPYIFSGTTFSLEYDAGAGEKDSAMKKERLLAFSDGVIAIIIT